MGIELNEQYSFMKQNKSFVIHMKCFLLTWKGKGIWLSSIGLQDGRYHLLKENLGSTQKFGCHPVQSRESHCLWNCLWWIWGISELDNREVQWTVMCIKKQRISVLPSRKMSFGSTEIYCHWPVLNIKCNIDF